MEATPSELRMACVYIAAEISPEASAAEIVSDADILYQYVSDGKQPKSIDAPRRSGNVTPLPVARSFGEVGAVVAGIETDPDSAA